MKKFIIVISIIIVLLISTLFGLYYGIKPVIKLNGEEKITLKINENYKDEGANLKVFGKNNKNIIVKGNVDTTKVGTYTIEYKSGIKYLNNKPSVKRVVEVVDEEIPKIDLVGEETITITEGEEYKENGYNASDNYDGDITSTVEVEGSVDISKPGEYEITYKVKDSSGNETSKKRKVIVKEKPKPVVVSNSNSNKPSNTVKKSNTTTTSNSNTLTKKNSSGTGKGISILMYHYFYDKDNPQGEKLNSNYMEIHSFEEQMKYLSDNNYYFPSWTEVADFIDGKIDLPAKSVVVTIDDGQESLWRLAAPVLEKYNVKATSFIITSKTSVGKMNQYRSEHLNFASHTHNMHRGGCSGGHGGLFRCIDHAKGVEDLKTSIELVGNSDVIAYPYGDVTDNVLSITKEAGFKVGVTTVNQKAKKGMDKLQLPRVRMSRGLSLTGFINSL